MLKSCLVSNHDLFLVLLMCTFSNNKSLGNSLSKYYLIYRNINMIVHFFIKLICVYLKKIGEPCMQGMFFKIFYKNFFPLFHFSISTTWDLHLHIGVQQQDILLQINSQGAIHYPKSFSHWYFFNENFDWYIWI